MPHRILYDGECRLCRWSLGWVLRWDRRGELDPVALQDPVAAELLSGLEEGERMASWHLVAPDGQVVSGGLAAAPMLRLLPGGRAPAALAGRAPGAVERAYVWVTRNRGRLAAALTDRAIARADAVIDERRRLPSAARADETKERAR